MVTFEDGTGEIVEAGATALASVPLTIRLGLVVSVSNDLIAVAIRAAYTGRPPDVADSFKAFGIINKRIDFDEQTIALVFSNHGHSPLGLRGAQDECA
jgi:hypothetical protein